VDYGYARVSSTEQDTTIQIKALERAGVHPSNIVQEKRSGVKERPVRTALLAKLQRGDVLWCWKLDRLGRSTTDLLGVIRDLEQRSIRFRCVTQDIDTGTASGRFMITLLAAVAELEREMIRERTLAGRQRRLDEGLHPGGVAVYGFAKDHTTVIEHEAALLRYVAGYVLDGAPMNQIMDVLNWRGYRTRAGKLWTVKTMKRILVNPYAAPLLGQEQFDKLARIFGQPDRQRIGKPAQHLLSGILTCHRCTQPLYAIHTKQRDGSRRRVYACIKSTGGRFTGCGSVRIAADRVDAWAEDIFQIVVAGPDFAAALSRRQAELLSADVTAEELDAWREEMAELEQVMPTRYAPPNAQERHQELRRLVEQATAQLLAQPDLQELISLPKSEEHLADAWSRWSTTDRRRWLKRILVQIQVHPATSRSRASSVEERLEPIWRI
jgi:DNA invertase Pin-like site-specific DNA recombinase